MNRFRYYLPILGYHRIGRFQGDHVPTVSAEAFERQLAYLAAHRVRVMSLEEVTALLDDGKPFPRRSAVITFDDGYADNATLAWPLLKRHGFPATVFVTPGEVGLPGFLTWDQVGALAREGMTIGSHTMHHSYLPLVKEQQLDEELVGSKRVLEDRLQRPVDFISYPIGGFTMQARAIVERAGYRAACTTNRASPVAPVDRFALRRVKMTDKDAHPLALRVKLSGYYDCFRQLKQPG